jgi:hypothetical protein
MHRKSQKIIEQKYLEAWNLKQGYLSGQGLLPTIGSDDKSIKMPSDHFDGLLTAMYGWMQYLSDCMYYSNTVEISVSTKYQMSAPISS